MLSRYDPFSEALTLRRAMDQLFEHSFVHPGLMPGSTSLMAPMDVCETPNGYEVDVALPGVRPEDIELTVNQNTLMIRGSYSHQNEHQNQPQGQPTTTPSQQPQPQQSQPQSSAQTQQAQQGKIQRHQQGHNWLSREIVSGSFERTVPFPRPIDANAIQTKYENGILTIMVPLSEASRPKRIHVNPAGQRTVEAGQQQG